MRILFLTHVLPYPLDAGPKIRIYFMLRYLCQNHDLTLLSFIRSSDEQQHIAHLRSFCEEVQTVPLHRSRLSDAWHLVRSVANGQPFLIARDQIPSMADRVKTILSARTFDAVHADQLAMAQYASNQSGLMKTLDEHNAVWTIVQRMWQNERPGPRRWLQELEWRKLRRYETEMARRFNHLITVTQEDRRTLEAGSGSNLPITVIPICIDAAAIKRVEIRSAAKDVICIGGMFYPPNVDGMLWFAREVFPLIRQARPDTNFVIVGSRPDKRILTLSQKDPGIHVTGYVQDLTPYLAASAVFVVPLRAGSGMRVKILDAWAHGMPIVSTKLGCEGIEVRAEENILIADTPADFAESVLRILKDRAWGQRMSDNGRQWVEEHYDWRTVYRKLDEIYTR